MVPCGMAGWTWMALMGWAVCAFGGSLVLLWAFGNRVLVRARPRCVRCGYHLDGLPECPCPECGRRPRSPGEAFALGRRRWIGLAGGLVLLVGLVMPSIPAARAQGWPAALPIGWQARLMPHSDDARLWTRVAAAAEFGRLGPTASSAFKKRVLARMQDPDLDPTPALGAFGYVMHSRSPDLTRYTREELLRIALGGPPAARSATTSYLGGDPPPQGEEIPLRREAWRAAAGPARRELLGWLVLHPAGDEDLAIIRQAFEVDPWQAAFATEKRLRSAPEPVHALILDLFCHPEPGVRRAAVMACEDWFGEREDKPPLAFQEAFLAVAVGDPDASVADMAFRSVDDMSESMGPGIGQALASIREPARFAGMLHAIRRKDDAGVLPGLEQAAFQADRPLWQRAAAANTFWYVRSRTRAETELPDFSELHATLVDALIRAEPELLVRIGREEQLAWDPQMLCAIAARAEADAVQPSGLEAWLASHPALATMLLLAEPAAGSAREAMAMMAHSAWQDPSVEGKLRPVLEQWFPKRLPKEDGE